jgi:hypothetical protein
MKALIEYVVDFLRAAVPPDVVNPHNIDVAFTQTDRAYPAITAALYGSHTADAFYGMIKKIEAVGGKTRIHYAYDKRVTLRVTAWSAVSRQQADYVAGFIADALHRDWNDDHTINYWALRERNHIFNVVEILWDNVEPDDEIRQWNTVIDFFLVMENEWIETVPTIQSMDLEIEGALILPDPCAANGFTYQPTISTHDDFYLMPGRSGTADDGHVTTDIISNATIDVTSAECEAHSEIVTIPDLGG